MQDPKLTYIGSGQQLFRIAPAVKRSRSYLASRPVVELEIHDVAFGGAGVGRVDGKIVFVPLTIDGERIEAELIEHRSGFDRAQLKKIVLRSVHRAEPVCPVFGRCGGCDYQHIAYDHQLELKRRQVKKLLERIGRISDVEVSATIPCANQYAFRNRITVHAMQGRIGFFAKNSRNVVDVEFCAIASPAVNEELKELRAKGLRDGQHRTLRGAGVPRTFTQTNEFIATALLEYLASHATGEVLVDAYCGSGFFGHALADRFRSVIGLDWSEPAIAAARKAANPNEEYVCGDVSEAIESVLEKYHPETVILDPSADGVQGRVTDALATKPPNRLIYVSCNPATLARDLSRLKKRFRVIAIQPFDMFPQTAEIETVAVMERVASG
jgi:tRNA/tmRNA/rRNA uracil-C5-methylase (TrmA/RlmC/RlmD family)